MLLQKKTGLLIFATACFFGLVVLFHLLSARAGYPYYRDIHLGTALEYAKGPINLMRPMVVGFNASDTPTPQEVPVWQALCGLVFKTFGTWFGWANVLSLTIFATGFWPLWRLARGEIGERGAWWTLLFFIAQPLLVMMSGQASSDGLSLVLSIWFLFCADRIIRTGSGVWLLPTTIFGILSATTKLPLFMSTGLVSIFILLGTAPKSVKRWGMLAAAGFVSASVFAWWTKYIGECNRAALFPYAEPPSGQAVWDWYIGSMAFRLSIFNWAKGGWAAMNCLFGSIALTVVAAWALLFSRNRLGKSWFGAAFLTTLIFTHVVLVHRHYYILYSAATALLCATAAIRLEELISHHFSWKREMTTLLVCFAVFLSTVQGLIGIEVILNYDPFPAKVVDVVRNFTTPEDKLVVAGGGWGGDILFLSGRHGLSIHNNRLIDDPASLAKLSALGYTKLVMISESPLLHALQLANPGNLNRVRLTYHADLSKVATDWETVFNTDDLLIKNLPAAGK